MLTNRRGRRLGHAGAPARGGQDCALPNHLCYSRNPRSNDSTMTLFLDEEQVRKHLRMEELIPAMEKALIDFSAGKVTQPVRSVITVDPPG